MKELLDNEQIQNNHLETIKMYISQESLKDKDLQKVSDVSFELLLFLKSALEYQDFLSEVKRHGTTSPQVQSKGLTL